MEGDFMSFLDKVKDVGQVFERARNYMTIISQKRTEKQQNELLTTIENKVAFLKNCKLDSVDIDDLEEVDDLLTTLCDEYDYDSSK